MLSLHWRRSLNRTLTSRQYVIEIRKDERREIPPQWTLLSSTKYLRRYHTPVVRAKLQERAQYKEALAMEANKAFLSFLSEITEKHYALLRDAVNKLAVADCLLSLAQVAQREGYCRPEFVERRDGEEDVLEIVKGRHPMIEVLRTDPFVPNSVQMGGGGSRHKIITGPNMGGKSSAVRMTALCAIVSGILANFVRWLLMIFLDLQMAQVGSYVPAESMRLSLLDGVLTRMGGEWVHHPSSSSSDSCLPCVASDELSRGRSTFMVEMQETSDILQMATSNTLVVLDELGRGTSTFDGVSGPYVVLSVFIAHRLFRWPSRVLCYNISFRMSSARRSSSRTILRSRRTSNASSRRTWATCTWASRKTRGSTARGKSPSSTVSSLGSSWSLSAWSARAWRDCQSLCSSWPAIRRRV